MNLKRILLALEYDRDNSALLQRARCLLSAQSTETGDAKSSVELCLFIADYSNALERSYLFDEAALAHARQGFIGARQKWLEKQAQSLATAGFKVSSSARWGKPRYVALLEEAVRVDADLILKTTHAHGAIGRAFLAPGDWHLIRDAQVPLWLVKDRPWGDHVHLAACVDPLNERETEGGRDRRLLAEAHDLAVTLPAELHVIHAFEPMPTGLIAEFDALLVENGSVRDEAQRRHREAFDELLEGRVEASVHRHFEEGATAAVVPAVVTREGIDLVVMGAVARTGLDRLLIGSTAEQVLDAIDADLLIIK